MREILFRGKRTSTGEWVYGSLIQSTNVTSIWSEALKDDVEVDPDTVGQYTGIDDFNGHRIFEHDIISLNYVDWNREKTMSCYGNVAWNTHKGTWVCILNTEDGIKVDELYNSRMCSIVVGNIHGNPEILDGK